MLSRKIKTFVNKFDAKTTFNMQNTSLQNVLYHIFQRKEWSIKKNLTRRLVINTNGSSNQEWNKISILRKESIKVDSRYRSKKMQKRNMNTKRK